ncbi:MAG: hypothetical protein Q9224_006934, partial [Gallowayella concinna]
MLSGWFHLSCSELTNKRRRQNSDSGNSGGRVAPEPPIASSYSIPEISIPSFNPADYPSLPPAAVPSLPPVPTYGGAAPPVTSLSYPTITAPSTPGGTGLRTFTSSITVTYYTIFITTTTFVRTETVFLTTSLTSSKKEITALATDSLDANFIFNTIALSMIGEQWQTV